jgi:TolB-like protein
LDRLKERKLVEWTLAYLAGAWLVMQLVEVLADRWPLPLGLQRGIDVLLIVGFFVALTLAWYHGEKGRQRVTGPELLILAVLLFIGGTLLAFLRPEERAADVLPDRSVPMASSPAEDAPGIAVIPFRNLSGDPEQEYLVAGMHEALISSLSQIEALRVISRTSVMRYADTEQSVPEIANELSVDAVIEGSVNPVGDRVRITVQLINGHTDGHIWAEEYDRDLRDVLILVSQVAGSVAEQVEVALAPEDAELLTSAGRVDPELYDLYMRGRFFYGQFTDDGLARSIETFERAIGIDSTFAPAWAGLAGAHVLRIYRGFATARESTPHAERAAVRAVELDEDLAVAHTALGWVRFLQWRWEDMRLDLETALSLNPNDPDALHGFGDYLTITGSADDGLVYVRKATDNDPFSPLWRTTVVGHLHMMGRFEEAIAEADQLLELHPEVPIWGWRGHSNWQLGRLEEAIADYRRLLARRPEQLEVLEEGYASGGPRGALRAYTDATAEAAEGSGRGALGVAYRYARLGDASKALAWIERGFEQRTPDLAYLGVRPEFEFLRSAPVFLRLLQQLGLPAPTSG